MTKISDTAREEPDDDVWWAIRDCKELDRARQKLSIHELRTIIKIARDTVLSHSTQGEPVATPLPDVAVPDALSPPERVLLTSEQIQDIISGDTDWITLTTEQMRALR